MKKFYITTAIDYANGSPHLGHAYEKVLTDVIARFRRLQGDTVHFLTGLDEHGQKVQQSAAREGLEPQAYCDRVAVEFQDLCRKLNISNDDFIRTTEARHKQVVQTLLQQIFDRGLIYRGEYTGFYSTRQEQFLNERDRVDGEWPELFGEVVEITETAYFFKLSAYQDWLVTHINTHPEFIFPRFRQSQVLEFLKEPLNDLCLSRPVERLAWGIPLPFDPDFVTYVWFDALTNYISAVGYGSDTFGECWPADFHVIGKDILSPPHAVYWPIMLQAAGIELPRSLLVHGWWNVSGRKMSKTLGNVVNPLELMDRFGADSFRYFLMREMNVGQDSDFALERFLSRYTDELGNDLGNLVNRLLNMAARYCGSTLPAATVAEAQENELRDLWHTSREASLKHFEEIQFHSGLESLFAFIRGINRYTEQRAPWKLAKSTAADDQPRLETTLAYMAEGLRLAAIMLLPVMPDVGKRILGLLGTDTPGTFDGTLEWGDTLAGNKSGPTTILFPRPETAN